MREILFLNTVRCSFLKLTEVKMTYFVQAELAAADSPAPVGGALRKRLPPCKSLEAWKQNDTLSPASSSASLEGLSLPGLPRQDCTVVVHTGTGRLKETTMTFPSELCGREARN